MLHLHFVYDTCKWGFKTGLKSFRCVRLALSSRGEAAPSFLHFLGGLAQSHKNGSAVALETIKIVEVSNSKNVFIVILKYWVLCWDGDLFL